ncbi:MAG TPA: S9 family peptidase, partial [Urbifossiella sp.]|nr:S9 family peptidase [Urbifossiella sp.]
MSRYALILLALTAAPAAAQPPADPAKLTLDRIFTSDDFRGDRVPAVHWLPGGGYTTLHPSKTHKGASDIVRVDAAGKEETLVPAEKLTPPDAREPLHVHGYELSADLDVVLVFTNSVRVWRQHTRGDYWVYQRSTARLTRLGGDARPATLMFAKLSPDGTRVGYVRGNDLYVEPAAGGPAVRLTADGSDHVINGTFDWVYEEEFDCRDGWRWSPDGARIAYWQLDTRGMKTITLADGTAGTYPTYKTFAYPRTGERNAACRVGVVPAAGGDTRWIDVPGDTRTDYYIPRMGWAGNPNELVVQRFNRLQNAADVLLADATTGAVRTVLTERDGAWVDVRDDAGWWVGKGAAFTWLSERDGWRHLYLAARDGSSVRRVTGGAFDVIRVLHVDEAAGHVYFLAAPDDPTRQYLYRAPITGAGPAERVTPAGQSGWHEYDVAPDGAVAVHTYSTFGTPPVVELVSLPDHKPVRPLAANDRLKAAVAGLIRTPAEFFRADIGGGVKLDGWMMRPAAFDPSKKYPVVFHVYGEPAGQLVTDRWGGRNYLWHLLLTQQGYTVVCLDNRGTPCPRGRDWRKAAYRKVGTLAAADQAAAARDLLKTRPFLDPTRVGVWGWSGGGSMTLNQMFRHPDLYHTGMAVAPVPDMRLYDTIYQERYMGLPQDNAEDYRLGSPLTHAAGLRGNLLIVHGTGDDNVHYQGSELLADRLIELHKPFTLMPYPGRSHSINEGKN